MHRSLRHKDKTGSSTRGRGRGTGSKKEEDAPRIICETCGESFKSKYNLKGHVEAKHENIPGKHCCHLCEKRFRVSTHLKMHLWGRHGVKVEGYQPREKGAGGDKWQCGVVGCRMLFSKEELLERHGKVVHGEDGGKRGQWKCKYCGKEYFVKVKWEHCEKLHENKESRPEKCGVCGKGFPTRKYLQYHEKYTHNKDKKSRAYRKVIKDEL